MKKSPNPNELVIKSNMFNALFLELIKQFFVNFVFFLPLFVIYLVVEYLLELNYQNQAIFSLIFLTLIFSLFKISSKLITIVTTYYIFTPSSMEKATGIISKKSHSLHYSQITDIELSQTLWDRMCNVGDLIIHTANDEYVTKHKKGSLILKDIKKPQQLKRQIIGKISPHKHYAHTDHYHKN